LTAINETTGDTCTREGDYFLSSMPVVDTIAALGEVMPHEVSAVAEGLVYREFIAVGMLLKRLHLGTARGRALVGNGTKDNWIYIQEKDLKVSRLQIFNNWSPYLVRDAGKVWVGLEYICGEDDAIWKMEEGEIFTLAKEEIVRMGAAEPEDILDGVVVKMDKVYPAYFGTYDRFEIVREFTDSFENLFLIGRNGMHRYNNQDHSMLTAMAAVENIAAGVREKDNIWAVNVEGEYLETR
jgi:protoporphyrinogen oxidase